jgi:hypothetical protein
MVEERTNDRKRHRRTIEKGRMKDVVLVGVEARNTCRYCVGKEEG